ncbi:hypothetical protein B0H13DRAFT_2577234 [Mycena leptocephala]|nr:hypothetical protein B0H13DRAFT_2577234 [Mycena leptocephala]
MIRKSESHQKWLLGHPLTIFGHPYSGIMPLPADSVFQMTEYGILPYPKVGQAQRQFHMRGIPYGVIPYEELDCTSSHQSQKAQRDRLFYFDVVVFIPSIRIRKINAYASRSLTMPDGAPNHPSPLCCEYTSQRLVEEEGGEKRKEKGRKTPAQSAGGRREEGRPGKSKEGGGGVYEPGPPCAGEARWIRTIAACSSPPDRPAPLPTPKSQPRKSAAEIEDHAPALSFSPSRSPFHFRSPIPCTGGGRDMRTEIQWPSAGSTTREDIHSDVAFHCETSTQHVHPHPRVADAGDTGTIAPNAHPSAPTPTMPIRVSKARRDKELGGSAGRKRWKAQPGQRKRGKGKSRAVLYSCPAKEGALKEYPVRAIPSWSSHLPALEAQRGTWEGKKEDRVAISACDGMLVRSGEARTPQTLQRGRAVLVVTPPARSGSEKERKECAPHASHSHFHHCPSFSTSESYILRKLAAARGVV